MVIVDEVHEIGVKMAIPFLKEVNPMFRLGLSATPERHRDEDGTARIFEYFGKIIDPEYSLSDAIRDKHPNQILLFSLFNRTHKG